MSVAELAPPVAIAIYFIRFSEYFVVTPESGEYWLSNKRLGSHQAIGTCQCGHPVYMFPVTGNDGIGLKGHTTIRCTGDGGKHSAIVPQSRIATYGELLIANNNELQQVAIALCREVTCPSPARQVA